jgi:hypothetical protein
MSAFSAFPRAHHEPMKKLVSAREALESPVWLGGLVGGESFLPMRTLAIAALGEPLSADELGDCTGHSRAAV